MNWIPIILAVANIHQLFRTVGASTIRTIDALTIHPKTCWCGSTDLSVDKSSSNGYFIYCAHCRIHSTRERTKRRAKKSWNKMIERGY